MIKTAIFDMDGTMYDTERLSSEGWLAACKPYGLDLTYKQTFAFHGMNRSENGALFRKWFGEDAPYEEVRRLRRAYIDDQIARFGVPVKQGLFELLDVLKEKGIRICIATGTARKTASPYWDMTGVTPYLCGSVCGDEVTASKPNPEIFLRAAALTGTPPENCLVLEDSPKGVLAARTAGCRIFLIPDLDPVTDEMRANADRVLPTLSDAAEIVRTWPAV